MSPHLPAWTHLLLACLLTLQVVLPTSSAFPPVAALAEPAPGALLDRPSVFSASPFASPLPTPTPQPTPLPAPNPHLALDAWADPAWVEPGQVVTFTVTAANTGDAPLTGLTLTDALRDGLRYVPSSATGFTYAVSEKRLTWQAPPLAAGTTITGSFQARVQGLAVSDQVTNTVAATAGATTAATSTMVEIVPPRDDAVVATPALGGLLRATDDRLLLRVPRGAVGARTRFTYTPVADVPQPPPGLRFAFRLEAQDEQGQAVRQFPTPLRLTLALRAAERPDVALFYYDETPRQWVRLTDQRVARDALHVQLNHLTLFVVVLAEDPVVPSGMPSIRGIQSDLFTGAATINYEISLPAGAGGFAPHLALQFNSRSRHDDHGNNSPLGTGWTLSVDSWIATGWFLAGSTTTKPTVWHIDGVSYTEFGNLSQGGTFREAPDWRIVANSDGSRDAFAPDGRRYHFEPVFYDVKGHHSLVAAKWLLSWTSDANHNKITYVYALALRDSNNQLIDPSSVEDNRTNYQSIAVRTSNGTTYIDLTRTVNGIAYLYQNPLVGLSYNTTSAPDKTQVEFIYDGELRTDFPRATSADPCNPNDPEADKRQYFYTNLFLNGIRVNQWRPAGYDLVTSYTLGHEQWGSGNDGFNCLRRYALHSISQCDAMDQSGHPGNCLPAMTFNNAEQGDDQSGWLSQVDNGYGGRVAFEHTSSYGWAVTAKTISDATTTQSDRWTYSYANEVHTDGVCVAFQNVTETLTISSNPVMTMTVYHQFLPGQDDTDSLRGKEHERRTAANNVKLEEVVRDWQGTTAGVQGNAKLPYLNWEERRAYDITGASYQAQRTQYFYDLDHQGGAKYGNVTRALDSRDGGSTLYRTTERWYYPRVNTANDQYIVNRLAQDKLLDANNICQSQTRYIYDATGLGNWTTAPTAGLLKEVWQAGDGGANCDAGWLKTAAYGYDSWGNRTSATDGRGRVSGAAYDTTFHAFRLSETLTPAPGLGGATLTTSYHYYGLNADAGGLGRFGQLQSVTDPNGASTRYSYDGWGRVTEIRRPGADFGNPATEQYAYTDSFPFRIRHRLRDDANGDADSTVTYRDDWTFYDGLGQTIQTQAEGASDNQIVLVSMKYNALGLVNQQTVPYLGAAPGVHQPLADWSGKTTETVYDALGRVTKVTQPDGAWADTVYNGRQTAVVDALRHQTIREVDASSAD